VDYFFYLSCAHLVINVTLLKTSYKNSQHYFCIKPYAESTKDDQQLQALKIDFI